MSKTTELTIRSLSEDYETTRQHIEALLVKRRNADTVINETILIFEALCHSIFAQQEDAVITVSSQDRLGYFTIRLVYEGRMFVPEDSGSTEISPEERVLSAYAEKIDCSYHSGYNRIQITVRRGSLSYLPPCVVGMLLAIAACIPARTLLGPDGATDLLDRLIFPLEQLFANAVLMICAPVTFLSFLKNLTDTYIIAVRDSDVRKLHGAVFRSSLFSVLLAIATGLAVSWAAIHNHLTSSLFSHAQIDMTLPEWITALIPSDIFTPFQTISPFPLFIVAAIFTYALCFSGKYFDRIKSMIDTFFALFSRMLGIIMYALPFFVFAAFMDFVLTNGFRVLLRLLLLTLTIILSLLVLVVYYVLRLRVGKVPVLPFVKKLLPLLYENWKIGSAIDAVPYNVRYCIRTYRMDRRRLENALPVLSQINLDGNCFVLMLITLVLLYTGQAAMTLQSIAIIAMLVVFLSLGAPNQPGTVLIGLIILLSYLDSYELIPLAIFCEMFFGGLVNLINVTGDIVTLAVLEGKK